jgi:hypothetical protein
MSPRAGRKQLCSAHLEGVAERQPVAFGKGAHLDEKTENQRTATENGGSEKPESRKDKNQPAFDWVTARSACTLPQVFKDLRLRVEQDVKTRNSLRLKNAAYEFAVAESENGFKAVLKSDALNIGVTFTLAEHAIQVRDNTGTAMFDITLNFTEQGECRLMVNGEAREMWQVQRMALEDLMFKAL